MPRFSQYLSIYGARGANGVILITTRKGKTGDAKVTIDAKWGSNRRAIPNYDVIDNPGLYYELMYKALYNSQISAGLTSAEASAASVARSSVRIVKKEAAARTCFPMKFSYMVK